VLELGGSDPFIVMPSADLDETVPTAVTARAINNGQSCIAAKRFIVHEAIADEFERRFVDGMRALRIGDPLDPATQLGPLATFEQREILDEQVRKSVRMGARVLTGGHALDRQGAYYAPTVLTDIPHQSPAYREELWSACPTRTPPSALPTTRSSGSAPACGRTTRPSATASSTRSRAAWCS
jgi:succinate-semialdehyde dehydrogenase/glutarate-semialdehyde dehydrogenase